MIRIVYPGSRIRMLTFSHPGSRGQKGTNSRIRNTEIDHEPHILEKLLESKWYSLIRIKICCEFALVSISVAEPWHFGVDPDLILRNPDPDLRLTNPDLDLWLTDQDPQHWFQWATESREANQCGSGSTTMRIRNSGITAYYLNANWAFIFDICLLSSAALVVLECHRWYLYEIKSLFKRGDSGKIDSWK